MHPTLHNAALLRPKCRHFRLTPSASTGIRPILYDDALLRPACHSIRTARCLYQLAPCFARYTPLKRKFTRSLLCDTSIRALNLTASCAAKSMSRAKRPIKFYTERSKSARTSSRKSPIWSRNFTPRCLKKPLFSYKLVK